MRPIDGELALNKTTRSPFTSTAIERILLNMGVSTLLVCGVTTSACVDMTARDAADRGFETVIVEDAVAEFDEPSHEATLEQFVTRWGAVSTASVELERLSFSVAN